MREVRCVRLPHHRQTQPLSPVERVRSYERAAEKARIELQKMDPADALR